jgi:NAD(P)-dependent dehydrogenase (short-subunit alcohol dehydrogenase family)
MFVDFFHVLLDFIMEVPIRYDAASQEARYEMARLDGMTAVITGGASGIGAATARLFIQEGAKVLIADLQEPVALDLAKELGPNAAAIRCNVAREADVAAAIGAAVGRWGSVDILFNNAGFGGASGPLDQTTVDEYDMTMDVLLKSVFLGIKHVSPVMKAQGSGSIINTASVCAFEAGIGNQLYSVAKAAVVMMTKAAALEMAEHGVRVNAVCPGYIATPLAAGRPLSQNEAERVEVAVERLRDRNADNQPIARSGEPEDIARMVLFLASPDSQWVTGQAHVVDGGLLAGRPWRKLHPWMTERREISLYKPE